MKQYIKKLQKPKSDLPTDTYLDFEAIGGGVRFVIVRVRV